MVNVFTCLRRSWAENFDRFSVELFPGKLGFIDAMPPESRSSCSIMAGTEDLR